MKLMLTTCVCGTVIFVMFADATCPIVHDRKPHIEIEQRAYVHFKAAEAVFTSSANYNNVKAAW